MNTLEMLTTLIDAARQTPENRHVNAAIKLAEKRIDRLRAKKERRSSEIEARKWVASCIPCGDLLRNCRCWDSQTGGLRSFAVSFEPPQPSTQNPQPA